MTAVDVFVSTLREPAPAAQPRGRRARATARANPAPSPRAALADCPGAAGEATAPSARCGAARARVPRAALLGAMLAGLAFGVLARLLAVGPWTLIAVPGIVPVAAWAGLGVGLAWGGLAGALVALYTVGDPPPDVDARHPQAGPAEAADLSSAPGDRARRDAAQAGSAIAQAVQVASSATRERWTSKPGVKRFGTTPQSTRQVGAEVAAAEPTVGDAPGPPPRARRRDHPA